MCSENVNGDLMNKNTEGFTAPKKLAVVNAIYTEVKVDTIYTEVKVGTIYTSPVYCGIQLGSVLGPVLFCIVGSNVW